MRGDHDINPSEPWVLGGYIRFSPWLNKWSCCSSHTLPGRAVRTQQQCWKFWRRGAQCDRAYQSEGEAQKWVEQRQPGEQKVRRPEEGTGSLKRSFFIKSVTTKDKDAAVCSKAQVAIWKFQKYGTGATVKNTYYSCGEAGLDARTPLPATFQLLRFPAPKDLKPLPSAGTALKCAKHSYVWLKNKNNIFKYSGYWEKRLDKGGWIWAVHMGKYYVYSSNM